jgi:type I restriction enzyme, R subunit
MTQISPYPDVFPLAPASLPDQPPPACLMKSLNFEFLRAKRPELADLGGFAEQYAFSDPVGCLVKLRMYAENLVKAVFARHGLQLGYQSNLNDLLNDSSFKSMTPTVIKEKLHLLRIKGNRAVHGTLYELPSEKIVDLIHEAYNLGRWFYLFIDGGKMQYLPAWKPPAPDTVDPMGLLQQENKAAQKKLAEQEALMAKLLADLEQARAQAQATKKSDEETKALLKQAQQAANALQFSEEETRFKLIDEQLTAAAWKVGPRGTSTPEVGQEVEVLHQPNPAGKGYADYVLWDSQTGKPLAVIEAKKTAKDAEQGKMQARYYADGLEKMHGQRPIIFYPKNGS